MQVRAIRRQTAGARHGLLERRVDAPVLGDLREEALPVGGAQLLHLAIAQQRIHDRVLAAQPLQRRRIGRETRLRLPSGRQPEVLVQNAPQLRGGVDVEALARKLLDLSFERIALRHQLLRDPLQLGRVDAYPGHLHACEDTHQGPFHLVVETLEPC